MVVHMKVMWWSIWRSYGGRMVSISLNPAQVGVLTSLQFSMCFFSPSTVFLLTLLHFGHVTLPLATIWSCHCSSGLPGGRRQNISCLRLSSHNFDLLWGYFLFSQLHFHPIIFFSWQKWSLIRCHDNRVAHRLTRRMYGG